MVSAFPLTSNEPTMTCSAPTTWPMRMMVASLRVATGGTRSRSNARKRSSREIACAPSAVRSSVSATAEPSASQLKRGSWVAFSNGMTSCLAPTGTTDWALALMQNAKCKMQTMHDANNARLHFAFAF